MLSKPHRTKELPQKYPEDTGLVVQAVTLRSGSHCHDVNQALENYSSAQNLYNQNRESPEHPSTFRAWFSCVKTERILRGIVAEIQIGRMSIVRPFDDWSKK